MIANENNNANNGKLLKNCYLEKEKILENNFKMGKTLKQSEVIR